MPSNKKNIPLTIAISAVLAGPAISPGNTPWIPAAEAAQSSAPSVNSEQQQVDAFSNSQYNYTDAEMLAAFWGESSAWEAKLKIGDLVLKKSQLAVDSALKKAREAHPPSIEDQQSESFFNSPYNYDDAELLAGFWGEKSPYDAKLKIGGLLLNGQANAVVQALKNAQNKNKSKPDVTESQKGDAFFNSKYTYDDASLLATFWGKESPWDAKLKIGGLLLSSNDAAVQQALKKAKPQ